MKLEAGKYYITRSGEKVGPMREYGLTSYGYEAFQCGGDLWRVSDGLSYPCRNSSDNTCKDIIAEYTEPTPEVGTLKEIGARVGDVVQVLYSRIGEIGESMGEIWTIHRIEESDYFGRKDGYHQNHPGIFLSCVSRFRIISHAADMPKPSPVRTVTRAELVDGKYGAIKIDNDSVYTGPWHKSHGLDTLTTTIETLTQIRDALQASNDQT